MPLQIMWCFTTWVWKEHLDCGDNAYDPFLCGCIKARTKYVIVCSEVYLDVENGCQGKLLLVSFKIVDRLWNILENNFMACENRKWWMAQYIVEIGWTMLSKKCTWFN